MLFLYFLVSLVAVRIILTWRRPSEFETEKKESSQMQWGETTYIVIRVFVAVVIADHRLGLPSALLLLAFVVAARLLLPLDLDPHRLSWRKEVDMIQSLGFVIVCLFRNHAHPSWYNCVSGILFWTEKLQSTSIRAWQNWQKKLSFNQLSPKPVFQASGSKMTFPEQITITSLLKDVN